MEGPTDGPKGGPIDGPTDRPTDGDIFLLRWAHEESLRVFKPLFLC